LARITLLIDEALSGESEAAAYGRAEEASAPFEASEPFVWTFRLAGLICW